jgi:hypothetical protein
MSTIPTPNPADTLAEGNSKDQTAVAKHKHRKRGTRPDYPIPHVVTDLYVDTSFNGPNFIYRPPGEATNYSFQLFRATADATGKTPTPLDFYGNGTLQYLYIPYVHTTTSGTTLTPPASKVVVQTDGIASVGPPPTFDPSPLYYKTFAVTVNTALGLAFRHRELAAGSASAPANFIPDACAFRYRSGGPGQPEVILRLNNIPGVANPVDYAWRKINTCCASGTACPLGLACGPEDLLLQSM